MPTGIYKRKKHKESTKKLLSRIHSSGKCACHPAHKGFWKGKKRPTGKLSANWKGDKVGYGGIHDWIKRIRGLATKCQNVDCSYLHPKRFDWANISGKYKRDTKDWLQLCPSCHKKWDMGLLEINIKKCA